jgi:hypothetical protein
VRRKREPDDLDELIEEIVVDAYGEDEQISAFATVLGDEIPLPCEATVLGIPVQVLEIDYGGEPPRVVARCRRDTYTQDLDLTELTFPAGSIAAWLQAAYLRYLGHDPGKVTPPRGWRLRSWDES